MDYPSNDAKLVYCTSNKSAQNRQNRLDGCDFTIRFHPIGDDGDASVYWAVWIRELYRTINRPSLCPVDKPSTSETFPVRK